LANLVALRTGLGISAKLPDLLHKIKFP